MLVVRLGGGEGAAAAQVELAADEGEGGAQGARVGEGAEVAGPVVLFEPGEGKTGDRVVEVDLEQEEAFVIAETDVVARMKLLDELAFQEEGLGFAADDVEVKVVDGLDEGFELQIPAQPAGRLEVLGDALAQIARLAHIDDRAEAVAHQVDAGLMRQRAQLFANGVRHGDTGTNLAIIRISDHDLQRCQSQDTREP